MRRSFAALALAFSLSCGGDSPAPTRPGPAPTPTPVPPAPPATGWSIAGTLVDTAGRGPVGGATITPSWNLAPVQTGGDGGFQLGHASQNPPANPYRLTIGGSDVVDREVWVGWQQGARDGLTLDVIRNRPPFSLEFYRQFVRDAYDSPGAMRHTVRWTQAPAFYVKTVDQNGRPIEPEVLAVIREGLARGVAEFSGGRLAVAAIESGTEARAPRAGWIDVEIVRDPEEQETCGRAFVGANPGRILFYNDVCSCGSNKVPGSLVMHEVGHAMGFWHVSDRHSVMYPFIPGGCPSGTLSASERHHAGIMYSRPRGNRDPDSDPGEGPASMAAEGPPVVVLN